ncbi:hypothetical protein EX895_005787 [Sporisorium graminicola]|uniref:Zn(2)-C6 fungal-type domain-containing protein n=1 Tax=Sporisorium graminicola TaxID=280036 RepID=A0A4U7KLT9_9BASI|nr:hypothetical protein EX895_005787 [Sporisorium graminicola]TKY84707.1 hypothetical protein EX895_005787 [Sporisorium graminicola]
MPPRDQRVIPKACSNCRRKKIRCDLTKPACRNCTQVYHVDCIYDASLSYRSAEVLLARVAKAEGLLDMLSENPDSLPTVLSQWQSSRAARADINRATNLDPSTSMITAHQQSASPLSPSSSTPHARLASASSNASDAAAFTTPPHPPLPSFRRPDSDSDLDEQMRFIRQLPLNLIDHLQYIHWTWQWPIHCFADRDATIQDLARIHTDPPRYASPLLLLTMLAHAARFSNRVVVQTSAPTDSFKMGGIFLTRAKQLLYKQLDAPPTLSDTAAILMMASRQVACGSFTQAWVYSGMAIRMIEDMGIPAMAASIASSSNQMQALKDPETRRAWRLFWSGFTFDKTLAFGLGRKPALTWSGEIKSIWLGQPTRDASPSWPETSQASTVHDPSGLKIPVMAAITDKSEASSDEPVMGRTSHYPYETFGNWCSLSALLGEILELSTRSHGQSTNADTRSAILSLRHRLSQWRHDLPDHIGISDPSREPASRPPNIMALNMIYQTCRILVHSSGRSGPAASASMRIDNLVDDSPNHDQSAHIDADGQDDQVCRAAAIEIHALLEMWSRSFAFDRMTWLIGCCVYTGAVVNAQDVRHPNLDTARQAASRLNFASYALGISASFTPGIRKSTSALLEFAERINAEHRSRSHKLSTAGSDYVEDGLNATSPSVHSTASWNISESSPANDDRRQTSAMPAEAPRSQQKRKARVAPGQPAQKRSSEAVKPPLPNNGLDSQYQGQWNLGTVDLDTMFKEVLDAETGHQDPHMGNGSVMPIQHVGPQAAMQPTTSTSNLPPPPAHASEPDAILWENIMGTSHWNLDALINDKDLLDALGTLPLYPGDQP